MSSQVNIRFENDMKSHVSLELNDKNILHNIDSKERQTLLTLALTLKNILHSKIYKSEGKV